MGERWVSERSSSASSQGNGAVVLIKSPGPGVLICKMGSVVLITNPCPRVVVGIE